MCCMSKGGKSFMNYSFQLLFQMLVWSFFYLSGLNSIASRVPITKTGMQYRVLHHLVCKAPYQRVTSKSFIKNLMMITGALVAGAASCALCNWYWQTADACHALQQIQDRRALLRRFGRPICTRLDQLLHALQRLEAGDAQAHVPLVDEQIHHEYALPGNPMLSGHDGVAEKVQQFEARSMLIFTLFALGAYVPIYRFFSVQTLSARERLNGCAAAWPWYQNRVPSKFVNMFTVLHELYVINDGDIGLDEQEAQKWLHAIEAALEMAEG